MGYYVPSETPEDCRECPYCCYYSFPGETECVAGHFLMQTDHKALLFEGRHPNCPLVEVPSSCRRLIDAGSFAENFNVPDDWTYYAAEIHAAINAERTVILVEANDGKSYSR